MRSYGDRAAEARSYHSSAMGIVNTTPEPEGQKFKRGTFVRIRKDLGSTMSHFVSDTFAVVEYTYRHAYGCGDIGEYSLLVQVGGSWSSNSWYKEWQLTEVTNKGLISELTRSFTNGRV